MTLELSHFTAAVLFSVFASVVFGITQRNTSRDQIRYVSRGMGDVDITTLEIASSYWLLAQSFRSFDSKFFLHPVQLPTQKA
jgi:hypothetical protein